MTSVTVRAPATTGNVAVGFDVLGFAANVTWDAVTVTKSTEPGVRIVEIRNADLPTEPGQNTAGVALLTMIEELELTFGFDVAIDKGIPLGSGLGGSAASAVGAAVAANALLERPRPHEDVFRWALAGEAVSSGHAHPDNVAPCLYGGLTLTTELGVRVIPSPPGLHVTLVHPEMSIATRDARGVLPADVPLTTAVRQMAHLAGFVDACHRGDANEAAFHCRDLLIEPHRKALLPGFDEAADAAREAGALAFSLSGSGPTVFAVSPSAEIADDVGMAIGAAFGNRKLSSTYWVAPFGTAGAEVV